MLPCTSLSRLLQLVSTEEVTYWEHMINADIHVKSRIGPNESIFGKLVIHWCVLLHVGVISPVGPIKTMLWKE